MNISVIIPVYNAAPFLKTAVQSALNQPEVKEVILIEDGSMDKSLEICVDLEMRESRVKLFQHPDQKNHGASASRNLGIEKSKYAYLAFLDADDSFNKNRFEKTKRVFEKHPNADGVYEAVQRVFSNEEAKNNYTNIYNDQDLIRIADKIPPKQLFESFLIADKGWFHLDGLVIKKTILEKSTWFDETLRQTQDTDFILRLCLIGKLYPGELEKPVSIVNVHGKNRILKREKAIHYRYLLFKKWADLMMSANWSRRANQHIIRGLLYSHPQIFRYRKSLFLRIVLKTFYFLSYILKQPKMLGKLFK